MATARYHCLIPRPHGGPALLLQSVEGGWAVPSLAPRGPYFAQVDGLNADVESMLGLRTTVLRWVYHHLDKEQEQVSRTTAPPWKPGLPRPAARPRPPNWPGSGPAG